MIGAAMPAGDRVLPDPNAVAQAAPAKFTWAVLALTCHIELFTQARVGTKDVPTLRGQGQRRCRAISSASQALISDW